ncbi:DNA-3-methyladenine glycosylase I [Streptomyces phaeoluteigriseus]
MCRAARGAERPRSSSPTRIPSGGFPIGDDQRLFEKLSLEGFQSGLSWRTILAKRENFRTVFAAFEIPTVARFGQHDVERLLGDAGIVRHRGKIEAVINNVRQAEELIEREGSLAAFLWRYERRRPGRAQTIGVSEQSEHSCGVRTQHGAVFGDQTGGADVAFGGRRRQQGRWWGRRQENQRPTKWCG